MATVTSLSQNKFSRMLSTGTPVVVEFYARWCKPCQVMAAVIDDLAEKYAALATFIRVDIDCNETIAMKMGIQSIPTVIVFAGNSERQRRVGIQSAETIQSMINAARAIG